MNAPLEHLEEGTVPPTRQPSTIEVETIYAQHFEFVWRNLRRLGVVESQLRDATQDVFVVMHRRLHEWDGAESLRPWVYSIVRRVAADTRRRQRRKELPERDDVHALVDSKDDGPEANAARRQELDLLLTLLATLDDEKREVLILVDLEEMTVPEVATLLSVNMNTVYSRLRAARQLMRRGYALHRDTNGANHD